MYVRWSHLHKDKVVGRAKGGRSMRSRVERGVEPSHVVADYGEASRLSAISALLDCIPERAAGGTAHLLLIPSKVLDHPDIVG